MRKMRWLLPVPLLMAGAVSGKESGSPHLSELARCRAIPADAARLACYDAATAALQAAVEHKDLVIVDRGDVQTTQRSLFGIAVPHVRLFDQLGSPDLQQLDTSVTSVSSGGNGLTFTVTDGAVWQQTDDYLLTTIKPGRKVTIKHAALGSFFATFDKGPSVRVKRVR